MSDWERVISFESLYRAHRTARRLKRHKKEVIEFEANLSENLWSLHYDLKYKKYNLGGYHKFMIYDPKEREIQAISYRDRIVQHSICDNYLTPLLNRILIYDNCACRKNKGTSFAIKRLRQFMVSHYKKYGRNGYFVKIDVSKYFPSINHNNLKSIIKKYIKDENIMNLFNVIIDSFNSDTGKGLPMGNLTSQSFALLYLNDLDRCFKEQMGIKAYVRYMDDMILLVNDKQTAIRCLNLAKVKLAEHLLKINPKSQVIAFKNGVQFLGWIFKMGINGKIIQKLKLQTKQRIIKKAKIKNKKKLSPIKVAETIASYNGFLQKGMAHIFFLKLKEIFNKV